MKPDYIVNIDDIASKFWKHDYIVYVSMQGISFLVNADCEQEALDYVMDYIVDSDLLGLYSTNIDDDDEYNDDEYIIAGNYSYSFTTHNIHIEVI